MVSFGVRLECWPDAIVSGNGISNRVVITITTGHTLIDAVIAEIDVLERVDAVDLHCFGYIMRPAPYLED